MATTEPSSSPTTRYYCPLCDREEEGEPLMVNGKVMEVVVMQHLFCPDEGLEIGG